MGLPRDWIYHLIIPRANGWVGMMNNLGEAYTLLQDSTPVNKAKRLIFPFCNYLNRQPRVTIRQKKKKGLQRKNSNFSVSATPPILSHALFVPERHNEPAIQNVRVSFIYLTSSPSSDPSSRHGRWSPRSRRRRRCR